MIITIQPENKKEAIVLHCDRVQSNVINNNLLLTLSKDQNCSNRITYAGLKLVGQGNQVVIEINQLVEIH